jgi:hypothetical protein
MQNDTLLDIRSEREAVPVNIAVEVLAIQQRPKSADGKKVSSHNAFKDG